MEVAIFQDSVLPGRNYAVMPSVNMDEWLPAVNFADASSAGRGDFWGPRIIPDYQLFYVVRGAAELTEGGKTTRIGPGEMALYGPGRAHLLRVLEEAEYYSVHFVWRSASPTPVHPGPAIRDAAPEELMPDAPPLTLVCPGLGEAEIPAKISAAGVETLLAQIVKEYRGERAGYAHALRALLTELLLAVSRPLLEERERRPQSRIDAALRAIRDRPEEPWTVAALARLCGYHPSYFTELFRAEMGRNPKEYLVDERMKRAKQAVLSGERLESVALRLGYGSVHYFSSHFKKMTGMTPSEYRQRPDREPS